MNTTMDEKPSQSSSETRKAYTRPQIVLELTLETRAGTPLNLFDPLDPLGGEY